LIYLGKNLISWSSKKEPTVARSSTESKYKAMANTTAEVMWLRQLLTDLRCPVPHPATLWCDNVSAIYLTPTLSSMLTPSMLKLNIILSGIKSNRVTCLFGFSTALINWRIFSQSHLGMPCLLRIVPSLASPLCRLSLRGDVKLTTTVDSYLQ
jgi:hypothetical protein